MPKPRRNRIREERIHNEIIVDAYGPEEQARGWYYYLENKIQFPFTARCIVSKVVSPLRKGEAVEVRGLAPEIPVPTTCWCSFAGTAAMWPCHSPN